MGPKALILSTEQGNLRLRIQQRIRKPEVGDVFTVYLADSAMLYESEEEYVVSSYLGITRAVDKAGTA